MKKILQLVILLSAVQLSARGFAPIHGTHSGIISGVNFTPLQISIFPSEKTQLFDETAYTIFSVGLLAVRQQFSIISVAPLCGVNNYFLQVAVLCNFDGDSKGLALAPVNAHNKNYGLQTGLLNWSGDKKMGMQTGIYNENGLFQLGILNYDGLLQIGFYNEGYYFLYDSLEKATEKEKNTIGFQLGLLNNCDHACKQLGVSARTLNRLCMDFFNGPPVKAFQHFRAQQIQQYMLEHPREGIKATADRFHFSSTFTFSRFFSQHFGYPPSRIISNKNFQKTHSSDSGKTK